MFQAFLIITFLCFALFGGFTFGWFFGYLMGRHKAKILELQNADLENK
jgi:hypothetical protein